MMGIIARSLGLTFVLAAGVLTLTAGDTAKPAKTGIPIVTDWSSRHVIFSHPRTPEQAARIQNDVRYQMQQARRNVHSVLSDKVDPVEMAKFRRYLHRRRYRIGRHLHRDWSFDLGPGASVGEGKYPAKYSFDITTPKCAGATQPDFVVYGTGAGSGGEGNIVAFTNLYSGCPTGPVPADYWSYNTGGQVFTSPVISLDGSQVAFTQTSGGIASLVLLKWAAFTGQVQTPVTLSPVAASAYQGCTAPCMTTLSLGANDSNSSVFYGYSTDTAFVGDDSGVLHQFSGVFKGTPTEVTGGGWPATVSSKPLSNPAFDGSANTYVGDSGGFVYWVDIATGTPTASAQLDYGPGIVQGPTIDAAAGSVYVVSSKDGASSTSAGFFQLPTSFAAGSKGIEVTLGTATTGTTPMYDGGFNDDYFFSANNTGALFVCGNPGGNPTLYRIPITSGVIGSAVAGPVLSGTTSTKCSPVTDIFNPIASGAGLPEEWAFLSVHGNGTPSGCGGASCVMNFRTTSWEPNTIYNAGQLILDPNMNIEVADNSGGTSGASPPTWGLTPFAPTTDGTVNWRNQGALSGPTPPGWTASHLYAGAFEIVDTHNNIEIAELPGGTSGATQPTWPTSEGAETADGGVTWYNLGANPTSGLQASGGASGIIMDNTSNQTGSSQVYFSNLQNAGCVGNGVSGGGTGGCAVQASQQGLN